MANIYYPQSSQVLQRTTVSASYTEVVLSILPNVVFFFDTASQLTSLSQSVFALTSSWSANTINCLTASLIVAPLSGSNPAYTPGTLFYDTQSFGFKYYNDNSSDVVVIGRETRVRVYNSSSNYISNSCAVYFSGSANLGFPCPAVYLAIADGTGNKANVAGVATVDMPIGTFGYATINGRVDSIVSTNPRFNFPVGPLYLSPTVSGSYVSTPPTGSFEKVLVGYCFVSSSAGSQMIVDTNSNAWGAYTSSFAITSSFSTTGSYAVSSSAAATASFARTASFVLTSSLSRTSSMEIAWGSMTFTGVGGVTGSFFNSTVTRQSAGLFGVLFGSPRGNTTYAVVSNGSSGSSTVFPPTMSLIASVNQTINGFSMSMFTYPGTTAVADFNTASYHVFGN